VSDRDDRPDATAQDEPFLRRWARLKKASREGAHEETAAPSEPPAEGAPPAKADTGEAVAPVEGEQPEAEPLELPPLESLTEESDFGPFMRAGVDPTLRRAALRKMFRNPKYGIVDELDPYRTDFAAFTPLGDIVTADMRFHAERLLRAQMEQAAEAAESAGTASPEAGGSESGQADEMHAADAAPEAQADGKRAAHEDPATPTEDIDSDERRDS
jgi:hypothetical protein